MVEFVQLGVIFLVSIFAGMYGTLAGGPSLVTIATLIFFNISPLIAIASNRLGLVGLTISGWYKFHQMGKVNYRLALILLGPLLVGSYFGAQFILVTSEELLKKLIAGFTILLLGIMVTNPNLGLKELHKVLSWRRYLIAIPIAFAVGFYGGFYGAGIGTFISYILILLFGQTFIQSAGTNKMPIFFLNLITAVIFIYQGIVLFWAAAVIFAGSFIGGYIGTSYSEKIGNKYLKWLFISVAGIMALQLLLS